MPQQTPTNAANDAWQKIKTADERRPSLPGEHWIVFGLGALLVTKAARQRSLIGSALMLAAGSALLGRAASGREGLIKTASQMLSRRRF